MSGVCRACKPTIDRTDCRLARAASFEVASKEVSSGHLTKTSLPAKMEGSTRERWTGTLTMTLTRSMSGSATREEREV